MKKIVTLIAVGCGLIAFSQDDKKVEATVDMLTAPSSVAFNLLGISPSSIDQPTDMTSFAASVQQATDTFSTLPTEYAMEFLPYTLFHSTMTMDTFNSDKTADIFKQTFVVSIGMTNTEANEENDIPDLTRAAFGIKFSLMRPKFNKATTDALGNIQNGLAELNAISAQSTFGDETIKDLEKQRSDMESLPISDEEKAKRRNEFNMLILKAKVIVAQNTKGELAAAKADKKAALKEKVAAFEVEREKGLYIEFAGGTVIDFKEQTFNRSSVSKGGAWLTFTYDQEPLDFLGIIRYLYQPDQVFADDEGLLLDSENISTIDAGARLIYKEKAHKKLSLSLEWIYRNVPNNDLVDSSWRGVFNASYDLGKNQILTFTFGKDFDHTYIKDNNLVASLNYIIGLGAEKVLAKTQ